MVRSRRTGWGSLLAAAPLLLLARGASAQDDGAAKVFAGYSQLLGDEVTGHGWGASVALRRRAWLQLEIDASGHYGGRERAMTHVLLVGPRFAFVPAAIGGRLELFGHLLGGGHYTRSVGGRNDAHDFGPALIWGGGLDVVVAPGRLTLRLLQADSMLLFSGYALRLSAGAVVHLDDPTRTEPWPTGPVPRCSRAMPTRLGGGRDWSPCAEMFVGFSVAGHDLAPAAYGGALSLAVNFRPWLAVVGDFSAARADSGSSLQVTLVGVRARLPFRVAPFVAGTVGLAFGSGSDDAGRWSGFAPVWAVGGGLDFWVTDRVAVRLVQADSIGTAASGAVILRLQCGLLVALGAP